MAKQTIQARIIEALETMGCNRIKGRTNKYIVMTRIRGEGFYFVGKNGALRAGKNVKDSMSLQGIISLDKLFAAAEKRKQETKR